MKGIWKIRILMICVLAGALYMGYGVWNDNLDRREVLVGASWETPLSSEFSYWEHERQEKERTLNGLGLSLERMKKSETDEHSGELLGVKNQEGKVIVPTIYEYLTVDLEEGYIYGEMNGDENVIYERAMDPTGISEFLGPESENGHYYNYDGTDFIKLPKGYKAHAVIGEYVLAERDNHRVLLTKDGETILDLKGINIDAVFDKERGIFEFRKFDETYKFSEYGTGLIDSAGNVLLEANYGTIWRASDNRVFVDEAQSTDPEAGYFFLDNDFKIMSGKQYKSISEFEEGFATVQDSTGWHIINEDEEILADIPKALEVMPFSEGIAVARYKNECKYLDQTGKVLFSMPLPRRTEELVAVARGYSEGQIGFVGENKKIGFMDKHGKVTIEPIFDDAYSFKDGLALVTIGGKHGVIRF